ncbi:MAG: RNA recognition motif [Paramarteilia canceri]
MIARQGFQQGSGGASGMGEMQDSDRKIFVGGIPNECQENDLKDYFGRFGEVENVLLKKDNMGRCRGFGYITFTNSETVNSVQNAQKEKPHEIANKKVETKRAMPPGEDTSSNLRVFIGGVPKTATDEQVKDYCQNFGPCEKLYVSREGRRYYAIVTFKDSDDVDKMVVQKVHNLMGENLSISKAKNKNQQNNQQNQKQGGHNQQHNNSFVQQSNPSPYDSSYGSHQNYNHTQYNGMQQGYPSAPHNPQYGQQSSQYNQGYYGNNQNQGYSQNSQYSNYQSGGSDSYPSRNMPSNTSYGSHNYPPSQKPMNNSYNQGPPMQPNFNYNMQQQPNDSFGQRSLNQGGNQNKSESPYSMQGYQYAGYSNKS